MALEHGEELDNFAINFEFIGDAISKNPVESAESGDLLDSRLIDETSLKATKAANKTFNLQEVPAAALATVRAPSV